MQYFRVIVSAFFIFILFSGLVLTVVGSSDNAASSLAQAENALSSAYEAVLDSENARSNISVLLDRLNVCGEYLAEALAWYRLGDFEKAYLFAELCTAVATEVRDEASELSYDATRAGDTDFVVTLALSVIGVALSVLLGIFFWGVFKRRYYKRVLGSKPEVVY